MQLLKEIYINHVDVLFLIFGIIIGIIFVIPIEYIRLKIGTSRQIKLIEIYLKDDLDVIVVHLHIINNLFDYTGNLQKEPLLMLNSFISGEIQKIKESVILFKDGSLRRDVSLFYHKLYNNIFKAVTTIDMEINYHGATEEKIRLVETQTGVKYSDLYEHIKAEKSRCTQQFKELFTDGQKLLEKIKR